MKRSNPLLLTIHNPSPAPPPMRETWWDLGDGTVAVVQRAPAIRGRHYLGVSRLRKAAAPEHFTITWDPRRGMSGLAAVREILSRRWPGIREQMNAPAVKSWRKNPYWLAGKRGRFTVKATAGQSESEKDLELAMHPGGHVEHEPDEEAERRRRVEKRLAAALKPKRPLAAETAARVILRGGGIDLGPSFKSWPFARGDALRARIRGRKLFRKGTRERPAIRWDHLHERLREAGFVGIVGPSDVEPIIDSLVAGVDVPVDGEAEAQAQAQQLRGRERLRRANPTPTAAAVEAFQRFHETAPRRVVQVKVPGSGDLVALGDLVEIVYRPTRGARRGPAFVHKFGVGAILAASVDGRELVLVPGRRPFRVDWERGIVG